jgi:hypothetical protein
MVTLAPEDRGAIARATCETVCLLCTALRDYPSDAAMRALLDEFGWGLAEPALAS